MFQDKDTMPKQVSVQQLKPKDQKYGFTSKRTGICILKENLLLLHVVPIDFNRRNIMSTYDPQFCMTRFI